MSAPSAFLHPTLSICADTSMASARGQCEGSPSHSTMSLASIASHARSIPMRSILSLVCSASPAVSVTTKATPPILAGTSIRSRVVPAISETIAASRPTSAFSNVDLPALGGPASTSLMPSCNRSAEGAASCLSISATSAVMDERNSLSAPASGTSSSSEKSSSDSVSAAQRNSCSRHPASLREKCPSAINSAARRWDSVSAESRSASPSASLRSIRPFSNARRVNSPAVASRSFRSGRALPRSCNAASTARTTACPPWQCHSTISSPVTERGLGKISTNP